MSWLYDPEKEKMFNYNLPIHENDNMFTGFSFREIMDVVVANKGHNVSEEDLKDEILEFLDMRLEDMWENFELCKENMLKEIRKEGE